MDRKPAIIIRKIRKSSHHGTHGGSWKVAYADFVTAMMAFFLLLWLVTMVSPEKRARIAHYFKYFSLFEKSGTSFMQYQERVTPLTKDSQSILSSVRGLTDRNANEFRTSLRRQIEEKLSDIKDQIMVDVFEGGVRIQLVDKNGKEMFEIGSAQPTPLAERILKVVTDNIKNIPNRVAIEGHTDALSYRSSSYTNWELSTERALSARKVMEKYGLNPDRISRVAGYADTVPLIADNPLDPRNRRISIILLFPPKNTLEINPAKKLTAGG